MTYYSPLGDLLIDLVVMPLSVEDILMWLLTPGLTIMSSLGMSLMK